MVGSPDAVGASNGAVSLPLLPGATKAGSSVSAISVGGSVTAGVAVRDDVSRVATDALHTAFEHILATVLDCVTVAADVLGYDSPGGIDWRAFILRLRYAWEREDAGKACE